MGGWVSAAALLEEDEIVQTELAAAHLSRRGETGMAVAGVDPCRVPECAARGGRAGHKGRHRTSSAAASVPGIVAAARRPVEEDDDGTAVVIGGQVVDHRVEVVLELDPAELQDVYEFAVGRAGPQPDVFSGELDAWLVSREVALLRKLHVAIATAVQG